MIRIADIILTIALVFCGILFSFWITSGTEDGGQLRITSGGKVFGTYSLQDGQSIKVKKGDSENLVIIEDGEAYMGSSNCTGQDCVHSHRISKSGETIVCLPHRLILEVTGKEGGYDSISR